jgi:hypothetical protein
MKTALQPRNLSVTFWFVRASVTRSLSKTQRTGAASMPNFSKDNTTADQCFPHAAKVIEYDQGDGTKDLLLLAFQYAESSAAYEQG